MFRRRSLDAIVVSPSAIIVWNEGTEDDPVGVGTTALARKGLAMDVGTNYCAKTQPVAAKGQRLCLLSLSKSVH